jgi:hypothetical protein
MRRWRLISRLNVLLRRHGWQLLRGKGRGWTRCFILTHEMSPLGLLAVWVRRGWQTPLVSRKRWAACVTLPNDPANCM